MRLITTLFLSALSAGAYAADEPRDQQSQPPSQYANEPVGEPQVTIITQEESSVEEYRAGGKLYMIKITPKIGKPYYLVDDRGDGKFSRQESLDSGVRPPRWIIQKF